MKPSTWREQRVSIAGQSVQEINFMDTIPNHVYLANNSAFNLYVSISPLVSDQIFDMVVPAYSTKLFARDEGTRQIHIYNSGNQAAAVAVNSFYAEFDPRSLPQTQEVTGSNSNSVLGVVEISGFTDPLPAGSNTIGNVGIDGAIPAGSNTIGKVGIDGAIPAGVNNIGKVGIDGPIPGGTNQIGYVGIQEPLPEGSNRIGNVTIKHDDADNGESIHRLISAGTINATVVKNDAGKIGLIHVINTGAGAAYLKIYDKAAAPDPGTDTPIMSLVIPAAGSLNIDHITGISCSTGISYTITGAVDDNDNTAVTSGQVVVNMTFI